MEYMQTTQDFTVLQYTSKKKKKKKKIERKKANTQKLNQVFTGTGTVSMKKQLHSCDIYHSYPS